MNNGISLSNCKIFISRLHCIQSYLLEEGRNGAPKMMTVGLHCRLVGRPGRAAGLAEFIDYVKKKPDVWIARRDEIAKHWYEHHYPEDRSCV